jgi:NADH-quinone oxidoreductase subunit L
MGLLAVGAVGGGLLQVPKVTNVLDSFLAPSFHDSRFYESLEPSDALVWIGLAVGAALGVLGISIAYALWVRSPERPARLRERFAFAHGFFVRKWYFDEAIDALFVRPGGWAGRFAQNTFERLVVNGALVGGASGVVRAASAAVRGIQSGYLRYYAALLLVGLTGLGAYFLVSA